MYDVPESVFDVWNILIYIYATKEQAIIEISFSLRIIFI